MGFARRIRRTADEDLRFGSAFPGAEPTRIVPNQTAAFDALRAHEVDAAELNPDNVGEATAIHDLRLTRTAENGLQAIYLNPAATPTNDLHLRRAIAYALDYAA